MNPPFNESIGCSPPVEQLQLQTLVQLHPARDPRLLQVLSSGGHRLQLFVHLGTRKVIGLKQLLPEQVECLQEQERCQLTYLPTVFGAKAFTKPHLSQIILDEKG